MGEHACRRRRGAQRSMWLWLKTTTTTTTSIVQCRRRILEKPAAARGYRRVFVAGAVASLLVHVVYVVVVVVCRCRCLLLLLLLNASKENRWRLQFGPLDNVIALACSMVLLLLLN